MQNLSKYIDLVLWKKVQDTLAKICDVTIQTLDVRGNIVLQSGPQPYFCELVNSSKPGKSFCMNNRRDNIIRMQEDGEKIIYNTCFAGLCNIMVPLSLDNKILGAVLVSALVKEKNPSLALKAEKLLGLYNEELIDALDEIKPRSEADLLSIGKTLYVLSNTMFEIAHLNVCKEKKLNELTILHKIATMVNSTLELDKILNTIMTFMLDAVSAMSCSILIFEKRRRFSLTEPDKAMLAAEVIIAEQAKDSKVMFRIPDFSKDFRFENIKMSYRSAVVFPLMIKNDIIGTINMYGNNINLSSEDFEFLSIVSSQAATAINNARSYEQVKVSAITDKLTGLYNRRYFMQILKNEVERSRRFQRPLSVILFDIDYFKHYNDTNGHQKGDVLLSLIGSILKKQVREIDTIGRYGGEEFIIVLPEIQPHEAKLAAERIRASIQDHEFDSQKNQPNGNVTISLGLVTCMNGTMGPAELIKQADVNLYKAKDKGRNNVVSSIVIDKNMGHIEVLD